MSSPNEQVNTPELNGDVGAQRRFRILVPKPKTHLLLGKEWYDPDKESSNNGKKEGFGYPGISAGTDGHLFIDVQKHSLIQSRGGLFLQTDHAWNQASKLDMYLSTPETLRLTGRMLLLGAGNLFDGPKLMDPVGDGIHPGNVTGPLWSEFWEAVDAARMRYFNEFLSLLSAAKTPLGLSSPSDIEGYLKHLMSMVQFAEKSVKLGDKFLSDKDPSMPNLALYGANGILQVAKKDISLVSDSKIALTGDDGIGLNSLRSISLQSGEGASIFGISKASLESVFWADVKAGSNVGVSSLRGKVSIKGKKLSLGSMKDKFQAATQEVKIHAPSGKIEQLAKDEVKISVGAIEPGEDGGPIFEKKDESLSAGKKGANTAAQWGSFGGAQSATIPKPSAQIALNSEKKKITIEAGDVIQINVGDFAIQIKGSHISIGKKEGEKIGHPLFDVNSDRVGFIAGDCGVLASKKNGHVAMGAKSGNKIGSGIKFSNSGEAIKITGGKVSIL